MTYIGRPLCLPLSLLYYYYYPFVNGTSISEVCPRLNLEKFTQTFARPFPIFLWVKMENFGSIFNTSRILQALVSTRSNTSEIFNFNLDRQ